MNSTASPSCRLLNPSESRSLCGVGRRQRCPGTRRGSGATGARLVHKHVLAAVAARDEPCGVGESQGVSTGDAVFTACGECSVAACSATTLSSTRARTISLGHAEPVHRPGDHSVGHSATLAPAKGAFHRLAENAGVSPILAHSGPRRVSCIADSCLVLCSEQPCYGYGPIRRWRPQLVGNLTPQPPHSSALKLTSQ